MYQLIEKRDWKCGENLLSSIHLFNLSIIPFLELKHLAKFHWGHHQFHHIGRFNQYRIVCTLHFTGNYIDDNAQTDTRS